MKYPQPLLTLIARLKKLPGVGSKTAERFAFDLLDWQGADLKSLVDSINEIKTSIKHCPQCHCLTEKELCHFCTDPYRDQKSICIAASIRDVFSIEETHAFQGLYHIIPALLSPLKGHSANDLKLDLLKTRIDALQVEEVIIALDSTLEGDTTSLYVKQQLDLWNIKSSRIAFGLPMGSSLDFVDRGTLAHAICRRLQF